MRFENIIKTYSDQIVVPLSLVITNIHTSISKQFMGTKSIHSLIRIADPEEISNIVVLLLSNKSLSVIGHTLVADGGIVTT